MAGYTLVAPQGVLTISIRLDECNPRLRSLSSKLTLVWRGACHRQRC